MKLAKRKNRASLTVMFLILTISATFMTYSTTVKAATLSCDSYMFASARPNPVGIGQNVLISVWLAAVPPELPADVAAGVRAAWHNCEVTITQPDGTKQTKVWVASDPVGSQWTDFVPDKVGVYSIQASFPGEWKNTTTTQTFYKPATSAKVEFTVQEESVKAWPDSPLPTGYWQRPIQGENREWSSISGNWLGTGRGIYSYYNESGSFNPYSGAPNTPHIVWTREDALGGITGGEFSGTSYYAGLHYEPKFAPPVIINGRLYYNTRLGSSTWEGLTCVDLRTGELLWEKDGTTIDFGQLYYYDSPNQHGVIPYLWCINGSTYKMYDAFDGDWILDVVNVPSGSRILGPDGSILIYTLDGSANTLQMWNSSLVSGFLAGTSGTNAWQWRPPQGASLNGTTGIQWKISVPDVPGAQRISKLSSDVVYARTTFTLTDGNVVAQDVGYNAKTGQQMWGPTNRTAQPSLTTQGMLSGVFVDFVKEKMVLIGYDINTGQKLWESEPYSSGWGIYSLYDWVGAYGKYYTCGFDGMVHCYDIKTGDHLWDWYSGSSGFETPYGEWPFHAGMTIADGKLYVASKPMDPTQPVYRGAKLYCINASTGELLWSELGLMQNSGFIADGYLVTLNTYDNQIYCFGKGLTATTISASPKVSVHGNSVLIEGTVTDQSPGNTCLGIPAAGTPAIADKSMNQWMEYLYMQQPKPTNATGVDVVLETLDPNGNFYEIGRTTSDANGMYKYAFTPEVPGLYTIVARFAGSESYWQSQAETAINVEEAPACTVAPTPLPLSINEAYFVPAVIGIIVTIIVVGAILALLLLRKRP